MQFLKIFILFFIIMTQCNSVLAQVNLVEEGNVIYSFKAGKMQCLSEIDPSGHITVLLKSLKDNTKVEFEEITHSKGEKLLHVFIYVEDKEICASWTDVQPLTIALDPKKTTNSVLTGKKVYHDMKYTVFISE